MVSPVDPGAEAVRVTKPTTDRDALMAKSIAQWETVSLDRPLFAPDRKPEAGSRSADAGLPRLTGIIAFPGEELAIFQPSGNGKSVAVRHGSTVGGWEVTTVSAEEVSLAAMSHLPAGSAQWSIAAGEAGAASGKLNHVDRLRALAV